MSNIEKKFAFDVANQNLKNDLQELLAKLEKNQDPTKMTWAQVEELQWLRSNIKHIADQYLGREN